MHNSTDSIGLNNKLMNSKMIAWEGLRKAEAGCYKNKSSFTVN